jgi:hypothetical protein
MPRKDDAIPCVGVASTPTSRFTVARDFTLASRTQRASDDPGSREREPHLGNESNNVSKEVPKPEVHRTHSQIPVIMNIPAVMLRS